MDYILIHLLIHPLIHPLNATNMIIQSNVFKLFDLFLQYYSKHINFNDL